MMTHGKTGIIFALLGAMAAAGPAVAEPQRKPAGQCFLSSEVNGFSAPNDHTVYVRVGVSEIVRLDLMEDCGDLTFRQAVGFERSPADPWICSPLDATIINHDVAMTERCPVTAIHILSPAEAAALPKKDRP
jgi:hypothetical protein